MEDAPGNRWLETEVPRGAAYDERFAALAAAGHDVHGEARFVADLGVSSVLDAGCGTGRVAIELARRGHEVVGVDLDDEMLAVARARAPQLLWARADLADVDLGRTFDAVVLAGNVMIFLAPGTEGAVLDRMARHLRPGGLLVAGFSLGRRGLTLQTYDALAADNALELVERFATWDRAAFAPGGDYAVSVHRRCRVAGGRRHRPPTGRGTVGRVGNALAASVWRNAMTITDLPPTAVHRGEQELPFVDIGDGGTLQLLQVDLANGVWIVRNHFPPGTTIPTHKHTGHVFAFTQKGSWFYKEYPDVVNTAGSYLYEPAGSIHTLHVPATNDDVTDVWFAIHGANLNLDAQGHVELVIDAHGILPFYRAACAEQFGMADPPVVVIGG
ncbi:MAG TPA: methyltransferase domain-containing protein [Acidimicrobiales bacterium]|nr:methyltransferase domain-containing protein [Acidimicrobiales bacterium]